jgi:hypothetical protein
MPEFICNQCGDGGHCKVFVTYDGYAEKPTGCLYESMRKKGSTGHWDHYVRKRKSKTE